MDGNWSGKVLEIQKRIQAAVRKSGQMRPVLLLGASKVQSLETIKQTLSQGLTALGENYVQELLEKKKSLEGTRVEWHLIGPLQTNKIKLVLGQVHLIHTLDRLEVAHKMNELAQRVGVQQKVLMQINIGEEKSKSGVHPKDALEFTSQVLGYKNLFLSGVMVIPPPAANPELVRPYFKQTANLFDQIKKTHGLDEKFCHLSMGMSDDFEVAVEERATIVRVGSALFGKRGTSNG